MIVTPHVGVWIETTMKESQYESQQVTHQVGLLIETVLLTGNGYAYIGHTSCRCVD